MHNTNQSIQTRTIEIPDPSVSKSRLNKAKEHKENKREGSMRPDQTREEIVDNNG